MDIAGWETVRVPFHYGHKNYYLYFFLTKLLFILSR